MEWMTCNTCRRGVQVNPTGICLACQSGFTGEICEDDFLFEACEYHQLKEKINAIEERIQQIDEIITMPPNCS